MPVYHVEIPGKGKFRVESPEDLSDEQAYQAALTLAPPKTTIPGYVRETLKAVPRGLVGGLETAALGAAALLPGDTETGFEKTARESIKGIAERFKPTAAPGYEEAIPTKLGEAVGSFGSLLIPGGAAGAGARLLGAGQAAQRAAQMGAVTPVAGAMGAGEARERAVAAGATPEQITTATQLGIAPGLAEMIPIDRMFSALSEPIKKGIFDRVKRALVTGGVEGAQEAASAIAQNLIAQKVYKPSQELIEGVGEDAAYGAGAGAIVQFLLDAVAGRRAPQTQAQPQQPGQPAQPAYVSPTPEQTVAPAPRTEAEVALAQLQQAQAAYNALPIDDPRRIDLAGEVAKLRDQVEQIDAAKAQTSAFAQQQPDLFGMYTAPREERPEFELEAPVAPRGEQLELPLQQPPEPTVRGQEPDLFTPPEPLKITDQRLTELGFSKTSKKARDALRGLDLTKATDLERFDELTQDLSGKVKFNPDAVGALVDQARDNLAAAKTKTTQPQLLDLGQAPTRPDDTAMELMFAQQRRNEGLPLTPRQEYLLRNQPTPEIITPTAPAAQPLEVVTEPERRPGGQFLTPTDIPKPLQEPVAEAQTEEVQRRRRSKSMPTRQMGLDFEGAPDVTGREAVEPSVVAPVPQPAPGGRAAGVAGPAGVVSDTGDVGPRDGREEVQQPALEPGKPAARKALKDLGVPQAESNKIIKSFDEPTGFDSAAFQEAYNRGDFLPLRTEPVGQTLPDTVASKLQAGDLKGALRTLSETGSTPVIRTVARKLLPAIRKTNIVNQAAPDGSPAAYDRATDTIYLDPSAYSEHALLHEGVHAAIAHVLDNKLHPLTQKLQKLFDALTPDIKNTYGATNLQEFAAESISNQEFQSLMRGQPKNWWGRFVDAIRGFLGLSKAAQVQKTLDQILEVAPMEARGGADGMLGMNGEERGNFGYHAGDLNFGRDTTAGRMSGRSTGHFGTGVYLTSKANQAGRADRPQHRVDLSKYNLYRPKSESDGMALHEALRAVNRLVFGDANEAQLDSAAFSLWINVGAGRVDRNQMRDIVKSAAESTRNEVEAADAMHTNKYIPSASTRVMQSLGWDGIDVRGLGRLDSGQYGTVVYSESLSPDPQLLRLGTAAPQTYEGNIKKIVADTPQPQAIASRAFDRVMKALDSAYPAQEARRKAMQAEERTANEIAVALGGFAQAGNLGAAAAQGAKIGGMKYDPAAGMFAAQTSKYSFDEINKVKEGMSSRYGLSSQEVKKMVDDWLEAERLLSLYRERDEGLNKAAKLAAAGNKKEAKRLRDKWEDMPFHMSREEAQRDFDMVKQYPEMREIRNLVNGLRRWTNAFQVDMGTASKERVESWLENAEWIPFQREFDPDELASMTQFVPYKMGIQASVKNPKYRGSTRPVEPVLENFEKWITFALRMGMREGFTKAAVAEAIRHGQAKPDNTKGAPGTENRRVRYYVDGQPRYALFDDPAIAAFYNSNVVPPKVSGLVSGFNSLFRKSIVGLPTFALKQLIVDSLEAIQKSGLPPSYAISIPIKAAKEFYKLTFRGPTDTYKKLMDRGLAGPFNDIGAVRSEELKQLATGVKDETKRNALMAALNKAELFGMRMAMHSDNAIRAALYQASQEAGMSEAQSYTMAADYINFRRQVNNDALRMYVAYVPFSGAAMSAIRSSLMAISGKGLTPQERNQALKNYAANMALLTTISVLLTMANEEDEAYKNMSPEQRARQLTIPGTGGLGIPRRVSIESLFPIMAELMVNQATSNAVDATQLRRVMAGLAIEALAPVPMPMPAPIKTAFEEVSNYNFFTGENIVSYGMSKREAWMQYGAGTSSLARGIGELLNEAGLGNTPFASPTRIDHVIRGLLGSVGSGMLLLSNFVAGKVGDRPGMTTNELLTSIPGFTMPAAREFNQADRNAFYDMAQRLDKVASTANALLQQNRIEEYQAYVEKNVDKIGMNKVVNKIMPQLNAIRKELNRIRESDMPNKDEEIRRLRQIEMNFIRSLNVPELRRMAGL